jgi:hypothetical protein
MDKVICIFEENHGFIGVAKDYRHAINFLIEKNWINENTRFWDEEAWWLPLSEHMKQENFKGTWQEYLHHKIQTDIDFFDEVFCFAEEEVY